MRTLERTIEESQAGRTVKSLLQEEWGISDALLSRLKLRNTGILLNGEKAYVTARVHTGDRLTAEVGDLPGGDRAPAVPMPLDVLYEDEDLLILNKPGGVTVHADSRRPEEVTLENALLAYLGPEAVPHPVSRLDRGTTGIITYAKSGWMHELLRRRLHTPGYARTYLGVTVGVPFPMAGEIRLPIGFAPGSGYRRAVDPEGAAAFTAYATLFAARGMALVALTPHTGRTHQLRVHMAAIGCPLAGDWLYGQEDPERIDRPALHSHRLRLTHPVTGAALLLCAPPPEDLRSLLPECPALWEALSVFAPDPIQNDQF